VIELGDGFWKTAQARGKYTHIFADPEAGQVASMGTMIEADQPLLMSLRLRIELGRITEVESLYYKAGGGGPNNYRRDGQAPCARGHVVQVDSSFRTDVASRTHCCCGRLLYRFAEERRQEHQRHGHVPIHERLQSDRKRFTDCQRPAAAESRARRD